MESGSDSELDFAGALGLVHAPAATIGAREAAIVPVVPLVPVAPSKPKRSYRQRGTGPKPRNKYGDTFSKRQPWDASKKKLWNRVVTDGKKIKLQSTTRKHSIVVSAVKQFSEQAKHHKVSRREYRSISIQEARRAKGGMIIRLWGQAPKRGLSAGGCLEVSTYEGHRTSEQARAFGVSRAYVHQVVKTVAFCWLWLQNILLNYLMKYYEQDGHDVEWFHDMEKFDERQTSSIARRRPKVLPHWLS